MDGIAVVYGSLLGSTEDAALEIARWFGTEARSIADAGPEVFDADLLVLGSSTWGDGELQDDWAAMVARTDGPDLTGKKVAVFGCCDSFGHEDTFADALSLLADWAQSRGATLIGQIRLPSLPTGSKAFRNGRYIGLPLDTATAEEAFPEMIEGWVETLKAHR